MDSFIGETHFNSSNLLVTKILLTPTSDLWCQTHQRCVPGCYTQSLPRPLPHHTISYLDPSNDCPEKHPTVVTERAPSDSSRITMLPNQRPKSNVKKDTSLLLP